MIRVVAGLGLAVIVYGFAVLPASGQKLGNQDVDFVKEATMGGMLEVELGKVAQQNAANEEVRRFGKRMAEDHGKANKELVALAQTKGITVSKDLDSKCKEICDKLTRLKGVEFDKEYMRHMLEDHEKDVAEFQRASKNLQDPDLKAWVLKTLPTLNEHLQLAKRVHAQVEKK